MKHKKTAALLVAAIMSSSVFLDVLATEQQPVFLTQSAAQNLEEYKLSKYDVINIVIVEFPDNYFNDIMIGPDGYVNLPYAGTLKLAGLTVPEASALLKQKLSEYIKIPSMAVMVKQYGPRKVYVMGEVAHQGIYSLSSEYMNAFAAISSAGGIKKKGRSKHIALVRTVDGQVQMREINLDSFVKKQDSSQNVILQDGDMVYVPKSNAIDMGEIVSYISTFVYVRSITD